MGVPPMEYVRQRRIERAKHLLVGQTPSDYRARALRLTT